MENRRQPPIPHTYLPTPPPGRQEWTQIRSVLHTSPSVSATYRRREPGRPLAFDKSQDNLRLNLMSS